jgi:hypothetical protein
MNTIKKHLIMTSHLFKNIKKFYLLLYIISAVLFLNEYDLCAQQKNKEKLIGYIPKNGFVPNKITAIRIAISVCLPIYGDAIYNEKPFDAVLKNGIWIVEGSIPKGSIGGVVVIRLQKKDGKILSVIGGK